MIDPRDRGAVGLRFPDPVAAGASGADRCCVNSRSSEQSFVPPYRLGQARFDVGGLGMGGIDDDVALDARDVARDHQDRRATLLDPLRTESPRDLRLGGVPSREVVLGDHLMARPLRNRNGDVMLTCWYFPRAARQLLQHRRGVMRAPLDDRRIGIVPPSGNECRAARIVDRELPPRITYPVADQRSIQPLRHRAPGQTAVPYLSPPRIFSTARAPGSDSMTISRGMRFRSSG